MKRKKKPNWLIEMRKSTDKSKGFWINPQFFNAIVCRPLFERSKIYDFIFFTFPWKIFLFHHGKIVLVPFKCCQQFIKDKKNIKANPTKCKCLNLILYTLARNSNGNSTNNILFSIFRLMRCGFTTWINSIGVKYGIANKTNINCVLKSDIPLHWMWHSMKCIRQFI